MRSKLATILALLAMVVPSLAVAQNNMTNMFSPYSMYGLGILETQGTLATRSMGGAGLATRSRTSINLLNPASYSTALRKGVLIDFGGEGGLYTSSQMVDGDELNNRFGSATMQDVAIQIPLAKGLGMGLSVAPYSGAGYKIGSTFVDSNNDLVNYVYEGAGTISLVKLGVGWQIAESLSIGVAALYYWGDMSRTHAAYITNIITPGTAISPVATDNLSVSKIKGQLGIQYAPYIDVKRNRSLTLGATFDVGGELSPQFSRMVIGSGIYDEIYAQSDTTTISVVLPRQLSVGATYNDDKLTLSVDYTYQNWVNNNNGVEYTYSDVDIVYNNVNQVRLGVAYVPNRMDIRKYMNRVNYRAGMRFGGYQYTFGGVEIGQLAVTAGMGFPINRVGVSNLDLGIEWSSMGTNQNINVNGSSVGLVKQNIFKIALGATLFGDDYWFQRPQID